MTASDIFDVGTCDGCGKAVPGSEIRLVDGKHLCKACRASADKAARPARPSPAATKPARSEVARASPVDLAPVVSALVSTVTSMVEQGIKVQLAPVQIELVHAPGRSPSTPAPVPRLEPAVSVVPGDGLPPVQADLDEVVLRVLGSPRRVKWRPEEIVDHLRVHAPALADGIDGGAIKAVLEHLADPPRGTPARAQVVKLATRYMRRDKFDPLDELDFVDLFALKVLDAFPDEGVPATQIHAIARLANLERVSLPSLLNHLRVLRTPAWDLVEKAGDALRDPYRITRAGRALLDRVSVALDAAADRPPWRARLARWGVIDAEGERTSKAILLAGTLEETIVTMSSVADKQLILAYMEGEPLPGPDAARKRALLELLGFGRRG